MRGRRGLPILTGMMIAPALLALLFAGTFPASAGAAPDSAAPASERPKAPRTPPGDRLAGDPCGAGGLLHLVGGPAPDSATLDEIRGADGPPLRIRVIRPGQPVTMDHFPGRLNILLDPTGTVLGLRCG